MSLCVCVCLERMSTEEGKCEIIAWCGIRGDADDNDDEGGNELTSQHNHENPWWPNCRRLAMLVYTPHNWGEFKYQFQKRVAGLWWRRPRTCLAGRMEICYGMKEMWR